MVRSFWICLIVVSLKAAPWREMKPFVLGKDQVAKIVVKSQGQERLLTWRWTLYTDKSLVVHESFDRFVGQHILSAGQPNQSFRKVLLPQQRTQKDVPYVVIVFKKFDEATRKAQFDLLLFDKQNRVVLDYITEK